MCETCNIVLKFFEEWKNLVNLSKKDNNIVPMKPEHFIDFVYSALKEEISEVL